MCTGKEWRWVLTLAAFFLLIVPGSSHGQTEKLARLVEAAKEEGAIDFSGPSSLTPKGAQALIAGLNKRYGLNLKLNYVPSTNYPAVVSQVITEIQAGQSPTYDVVYVTEFNLAKLYSRALLDPFDWTGTFGYLTKESLYFEDGGVLIATIFGLPVYNTKLVKSEDVPKRWEDLLSPKWKGKIVVPKYVQVWVSLSEVWGEEKTIDFLKRLKAQDPLYALYPEIQTRLASGEYLLAANQVSPFVEAGKQRGMPIDYVDKVSPVPVLFDMMGIPKKSRHPNATRLFVAFSLTPEGQEVWVSFTGRSSLFVPGTPASKFVEGKKLLFRDMKALVEYPDRFEKLESRFADILGIR
jgi:iron(III) transport system substrate-binding protein